PAERDREAWKSLRGNGKGSDEGVAQRGFSEFKATTRTIAGDALSRAVVRAGSARHGRRSRGGISSRAPRTLRLRTGAERDRDCQRACAFVWPGRKARAKKDRSRQKQIARYL